MKYLVHLSMPIVNGIGGDNLRGEPRAERHVLAALVEAGKEVYTTDWPVKVWRSGKPPSNLHAFEELGSLKGTTYISYAAPNISMVLREAENYLLLMFNLPEGKCKEDTLNLMHASGGRVHIIHPFENNISVARKQYGRENVSLIEGPAVPDINLRSKEDREKAEYLLWAYRSFYTTVTNHPGKVFNLFSWCSAKMKAHNNLKFALILGDYPGMFKSKEEVYTWFWGLSVTKALKGFESRVEVYNDISWDEVMELYKKTKLVISPALGAGGPPYEAAIHGIPIIFGKGATPYKFNGVITIDDGLSGEFISMLDKLLLNEAVYTKCSKLYYNYVKSHATYNAWVAAIENKISNLGWE